MKGKEWLPELKTSGFKYSEDELVFIAHDKSGQLLWLEEGNESAGLMHIKAHHAEDFRRAHGVAEDEIADLLFQVVTNGDLISNRPSLKGHGYDRVYDYEDNYYTFMGVGSNGFIVTAFPVGK